MEHRATWNLQAEKVLEEEEKMMQEERGKGGEKQSLAKKTNPQGAMKGSRALPSPLQSPAEPLENSAVQKGLAWTR